MKRWAQNAALIAVLFVAGLVGLWLRPSFELHRQTPPVVMEVLDPSLAAFAPLWRDEIGRRFDNAVGILVHGGDFVEGQWIAGTNVAMFRRVTPMREVVEHYQRLYPDRVVVLLACNTGSLRLGIPGVYYAKSSVWSVPDRAVTPEMYENGLAEQKLPDCNFDEDPEDEPPQSVRPAALSPPKPTRWQGDPDVVGNVFEFVSE